MLRAAPPHNGPTSHSDLHVRVAVVGAGAIGLSTAWRLLQRGARVDVYDRGVGAIEPTLAATAVAGRLCPHDHQVDARRLVGALAEAVRRAGGTLHERAEVAVNSLGADVVVLAAGAWTAQIAGARSVPVRPLKGQMLALRTPPN